jgi:archaellum component FlaC
MSDAPHNLILDHLRAIRATQDEHTAALGDMRQMLGALIQIAATQENRLNRVSGDVERIKKRLELVDA